MDIIPSNCLSIFPPQHLPTCPEGHKTKIVIFSLCWHCKWPERILPCAIFIHLLPVGSSLSLCKPPSLTALENAKGVGLCLENVLGIWNWEDRLIYRSLLPPSFLSLTSPFRLPKPAFFPTTLHYIIAAILWLQLDLLPEMQWCSLDWP